ncbi:hypothetical protein M3G00_16150 [Brevibacterium casei]|uniref:Major facilitator superfamily (MFS) profile domain-containing protein n=2 Tax=Brevibacterium TaxID=1696 RepID=A0AB34XVF1_9MICO|nr:hypothetical protein [Brevibacterium casei]NJE66120.1 hypothetical protein [Brevibacterium sp. LS14]KZE23459.1 hypothetical protein AVW13_04425 [Brevibacterium casei]MBE4693481.1 hypothetical protein [Brevibacterium casei]MBY3576604.1 hypothetical protein [Brevibacterium casei]MCT2184460.1 hypothetical protein [Brevibacterium casei]
MTPTFRKRLSFGRFVLLTAGIGAASGLIISLVVLEFDPGQIVMLVVSTAFGGVLGLVMGIPAEFAVRLAAPRLRSRVGAVLCCFGLGLVSVLVALNILGMIIQGPGDYIGAYEWSALLFALALGLPAGVLTACATSHIVEPVEPKNPRIDRFTGLPY